MDKLLHCNIAQRIGLCTGSECLKRQRRRVFVTKATGGAPPRGAPAIIGAMTGAGLLGGWLLGAARGLLGALAGWWLVLFTGAQLAVLAFSPPS